MTVFFRIFFCILSVLCVAAALPVGAFLGWQYAAICALAAFLCFAATVFFKNGGRFRKKELPKPDFMNSPEENERLLNALKEQEREQK